MMTPTARAGRDALSEPSADQFLWVPEPSRDKELYAGFRGTFEVGAAGTITVQILASNVYEMACDGAYLSDGPARWADGLPEYEVRRLDVSAGRHVLAAIVHNIGQQTEFFDGAKNPPFLLCRVFDGEREVPVQWRCTELEAFSAKGLRVSPQLGWTEWCDTRKLPLGWDEISFDDSGWKTPVPAKPEYRELNPLSIGPVGRWRREPKSVERGTLLATALRDLWEDPSWAFYSRRQDIPETEATGVYLRIDLGRVALGKIQLTIDAPADTTVDMACADYLTHGRVSPWIALAGDRTCSFNQWITRGGRQTYAPLLPRGGRYWEIHIAARPEDVEVHGVEFLERSYLDSPAGAFQCGDAFLDRAWTVGINTLRACMEDAILDCPTRERGQWTGDGYTIGLELTHAGYNDLSVLARGMRQAAHTAREDGLVAGLTGGFIQYLPTYSLYWINGCWRYYEITGDSVLLDDMFDAAVRNLAVFSEAMDEDALVGERLQGWTFVDWGYIQPEGQKNAPLNLAHLSALRDMAKWAKLVGSDDVAAEVTERAAKVRNALLHWKANRLEDGGWDAVGYHAAVFALRENLVDSEEEAECIAFIKRHIWSCFPFNPRAPRQTSPHVVDKHLFTTFFAHFALSPLVERGELAFVIDTIRTGWGWALEQTDGTWLELFDTNWSHAHQWSGCPTWLMTRYLLGLNPRYDLGPRTFEFAVADGAFSQVSGRVPLPYEDGHVDVRWTRGDEGPLDVHIETTHPITLHLVSPTPEDKEVVVEVEKYENLRFVWPGWTGGTAR